MPSPIIASESAAYRIGAVTMRQGSADDSVLRPEPGMRTAGHSVTCRIFYRNVLEAVLGGSAMETKATMGKRARKSFVDIVLLLRARQGISTRRMAHTWSVCSNEYLLYDEPNEPSASARAVKGARAGAKGHVQNPWLVARILRRA